MIFVQYFGAQYEQESINLTGCFPQFRFFFWDFNKSHQKQFHFLWFAGKLFDLKNVFVLMGTYCSRSAHNRSQSGHWNSMRPSSSLSRSPSASVDIFKSLLLFGKCKSMAGPKSSSIAPLCWEPKHKKPIKKEKDQ